MSTPDMYSWTRGANLPLTPHFRTSELECSCGACQTQTISYRLLARLEAIRREVKAPVWVHSAYRCTAYQNHLRGTLGPGKTAVGTSQHELGLAADISVAKLPIPDLLAIADKYFFSIGVARSFLHLDMRDDRERRWSY